MSPPISGTLWREVCAGGHVIDNEYVPAGYDVGVNPYAVHHNEDCFPDSFTFKPERWIPSADNPEKDIERARRAFSVYSIGSRACAGRNMAYTELGDSIARTMWYSDFRRPEGPLGVVGAGAEGSREGRHRVKEFQLMEHLTCSHDGPFLQFCGRKGLTDELFHDRRAPPASF
ncbi:MAG: Cytochrome P450 [Lasallia pustulata]|uniref:Cytochrome P450 n=1 Tax=Lasallia pustulata TaxID=136370 RepID=A0A5M8Q590_9LECA|nr:MAG: Cytochrome P450 [Lasallia pustulata]